MPGRGGSRAYTSLDVGIKVREGTEVLRLRRNGHTFTEIGARLGLSATTAWRRYWWLLDWTLPSHYGLPNGPIPPLRGTRAVPRGRPCLPTLDHPELYRLRPRPAVPCKARRKDGQPCGAYAIHGGTVCRMHGGAAPQVKRAAAERHTRAKAAALLAQIRHTYCNSP